MTFISINNLAAPVEIKDIWSAAVRFLIIVVHHDIQVRFGDIRIILPPSFLRRARDGDDARMCGAGAEGIVENHRDVLAFFVIVMRFS